MSCKPQLLLTVLVLFLSGSSCLGAAALNDSDSGIEDRWRSYLDGADMLEPELVFPFEHCFRRSASAHGLPLTLLLAVARGESDFDSRAVSSADAMGLMQIRWPLTARHLGIHRKSRLFDPCTNVDAGARYLKELLQRYEGDLHRALTAYNRGPSRVPGTDRPLPEAEAWYSDYIWRHLVYVVGEGVGNEDGRKDYSEEGRLAVITFDAPYRAEAFVTRLELEAPGARLEWFREDAGRFQVVLLYRGENELKAGRRRLKQAGFPVPGP